MTRHREHSQNSTPLKNQNALAPPHTLPVALSSTSYSVRQHSSSLSLQISLSVSVSLSLVIPPSTSPPALLLSLLLPLPLSPSLPLFPSLFGLSAHRFRIIINWDSISCTGSSRAFPFVLSMSSTSVCVKQTLISSHPSALLQLPTDGWPGPSWPPQERGRERGRERYRERERLSETERKEGTREEKKNNNKDISEQHPFYPVTHCKVICEQLTRSTEQMSRVLTHPPHTWIPDQASACAA